MTMQVRPEACYCAAARQASRVVSRIYDRHLANAALTIPQFSLLWIISDAGEVTAVALTERLAMDRTTLVRALKPLLRDGLVCTRRAQPSNRQLLYLLTDAGRARVEQAMPFWTAAQQEIEARVGAEPAAALRHDTQDMIETLI